MILTLSRFYHLNQILIAFKLAQYEYKSEIKSNFTGIIWWIADPLLNLFIYYFVFTHIFPSKIPHFTAFLFINLVFWRWISVTLTNSAYSVVANASLLKNMYIPKYLFPIKCYCSELINLSIGLIFIFVALVLSGIQIQIMSITIAIFVFIISSFFIVNLSVIFAYVGCLYPDFKNILNFVFRALIFTSGVFYDIAGLSEKVKFYFMLSPFALMLDFFRNALLHAKFPAINDVTYFFLISLMLFPLAAVLHRKMDKKVLKYLY